MCAVTPQRPSDSPGIHLETDSIKTYKRILSGEIRAFPPVFFPKQMRKKRIEQLTSYLVEQVLRISPEEAAETITLEMLKQHRLDCLLQYVEPFPEWTEKRAILKLLRMTYPRLTEETMQQLVISVYDEVLSGARRKFPTNYFHSLVGEERASICVKHLCENVLKIPLEEIPKKVTRELLQEYKLKILLNLFYDSPYDLVTAVYPHFTSRDFH